jgi:hypothetical protein
MVQEVVEVPRHRPGNGPAPIRKECRSKINLFHLICLLITWSIFNPGDELSPVDRVEISALSVIENSIKIKHAIM